MEPAHELLNYLLDLWQRNPDGCNRKSLLIKEPRAKAYFSVTNPEDKDQLHACLINAKEAGCISLVWGRLHESHHLKKIVLEDGEKLAAFLNVPLARDVAQKSADDLSEIFQPSLIWVLELRDKALGLWKRNKSAFGIKPGNVAELATTLHALEAVENNLHRGIDLRTFSTKVLGDSKAMEKIQDRFVTLWGRYHDTGSFLGHELYESLELTKFPPAVYFKGPLKLQCGQCELDMTNLPAFLGLPPDSIDRISTTIPFEAVDYVLTIENLASFNRHCREVDDCGRGVVIFSSGYLNPLASELLRKIDRLLPASVPFFHWGDIDAGGLNIYHHINGTLTRNLRPHLMTDTLLLNHGKQPDSLSFRHLAKSADSDPFIARLKEVCLSKNLILEQEAIDPQLPQIL